MIDEAAESRQLLSVFRERPHSVDPARTEARRARALPRLRRHVAIVASRHARIGRLRHLGFALAALVTLAVVGVCIRELGGSGLPGRAGIRAVEGHLVHHASGELRRVSAGETLALPISGELSTEIGTAATLETSEGLRMHLEGSSRLGLEGMSAAQERSVELRAGQIQCAVPKLSAGGRFAVVTPNARVVVHGTRFTVRVDSAEAGVTRTCVRVSEGIVAVRHVAGEAMLRAGEEWGCSANEGRAAGPSAKVASPRSASPTARTAVRATAGERSSGTLGEETALLQTALAAERKGQRSAATAALLRLVSRYPESPLAPEARTVLERVSREPPPAP